MTTNQQLPIQGNVFTTKMELEEIVWKGWGFSLQSQRLGLVTFMKGF